ncbi:conserved hypothetical protein [Verticillium alfalfae VaMs.102]|uniref:Myb/SANT-like domain-containing protein n=1 Tax=Verticillium alfalfae (strain VaMs.102 / ATCC MYA-4576 / FGSC 10136) TaxID=526221 RepID=C9SUH5_VERA1|nr:conserved hypothetical protein [Verticillium alfalfae VaMs.102]EEY22486.1 conserved hypothetical protein [Verticillium alfalfae VaMs.102]
MSDDEFSIDGPSGLAASSDRDKRAPRFSWTPAYEATFFRALCEAVQLGLRENHSFKAEAWDRAAAALQEKHAAYPTKNHLVNKSDNARKKFRLWRGLREDPEFLYNPNTRTVTATEEAWRSHIEAMDIFFRDFADEDMDLQLKIAEKALADENKAMVFCKMPATLRKHWVKRLREVHNNRVT